MTLTVQRAGVPSFDVTIVRRKYDLPLSSWVMIPGRKVAYIRLDQFATGAGKAVEDAITAAKAAGATAIIFDLRDNGGRLRQRGGDRRQPVRGRRQRVPER